jgi:hypothetical protein
VEPVQTLSIRFVYGIPTLVLRTAHKKERFTGGETNAPIRVMKESSEDLDEPPRAQCVSQIRVHEIAKPFVVIRLHAPHHQRDPFPERAGIIQRKTVLTPASNLEDASPPIPHDMIASVLDAHQKQVPLAVRGEVPVASRTAGPKVLEQIDALSGLMPLEHTLYDNSPAQHFPVPIVIVRYTKKGPAIEVMSFDYTDEDVRTPAQHIVRGHLGRGVELQARTAGRQAENGDIQTSPHKNLDTNGSANVPALLFR